MDVLRPDRDSGAGERVAHRREADEGRADHANDVDLANAPRDGRRELPRVGRRGVHLPVAGDDHRPGGGHAAVMPRSCVESQ